MTRIKRTIAAILAGAGWTGSFGITISTPHVDIIRDNPIAAIQVVILLGLAAAVLTLGLWIEGKTQSSPVEEVLQIGMRAGERVGAIKRQDARTPDDLGEWWNAPMGRRDTPPAGWRRG